ncbi:2-hydroxy-3-oxopropionate reductase [Paenibacillus contaminans]|uniref:2-hydroxy-3-oxopropionate reductase n=1 Tax=Paenibacillus contaminans TaxID=450362 RepID=A0A329MBX6_9BACL|nr:2-hydroxy-3-oxopropionate reductase [Paenibacillus contaminans]RAV16656.1 2-hydroxy-3-oxopropionate reductase [Paenibacillus contaminans]
MKTITTIGFIGLGIMGKPMAKNLIRAGYKLNVCSRSKASVEQMVCLGATASSYPKEVAQLSDIVITMLPDSPQVEEVALGENGLIEGFTPGKIYVDMSSIHPMTARKVAAALMKQGVSMLDAPVSGGEIGAIEAKLAIIVGGPQETVDQVTPLLKKMGSTVTRVGDIGAGNTVKLINQIIVAINIAAISEGLAFGKKAGIDANTAFEAIRGGLAGSRVLETKITNISRKHFSPGFRMSLHKKDLSNALSMSAQMGMPLEFTTRVYKMFEQLSEEGYSSEDHSALYRCFDQL